MPKIRHPIRLLIVALAVVGLLMFIFKTPPFCDVHLVQAILDTDPSELFIVTVEPLRYIRVDNNLVDGKVAFTDRRLLAQLGRSINAARTYRPDHPKSQWNCLVTLISSRGRYAFRVKKTFRNGTLMQVWSRKEWGWRLGRFRSDQLGEVLEHLVSQRTS